MASACRRGRRPTHPGTETVWGLANGKGEALRRQLEASGLRAFEGARLYLELARDAGVRCAVVSPSATAGQMLEEVRLATLVDDRIDGDTMRVERLRPAPAPDTLLAACRHLGVEPGRAAVFETTPDGVAAGRDGGFELVIGIAQAGGGSQLRGVVRTSSSPSSPSFWRRSLWRRVAGLPD